MNVHNTSDLLCGRWSDDVELTSLAIHSREPVHAISVFGRYLYYSESWRWCAKVNYFTYLSTYLLTLHVFLIPGVFIAGLGTKIYIIYIQLYSPNIMVAHK